MRGPYPECEHDTCKNDHLPILRCNEIVDSEEEALFSKEGVFYGRSHFWCIECVESSPKRLKVWNSDYEQIREAYEESENSPASV